MIVTPSYQNQRNSHDMAAMDSLTNRGEGLAVPLAIVSRIPVPATRSAIKSVSPSSSRISSSPTTIYPASFPKSNPLPTRERSGTTGQALKGSTASANTSPRVQQNDAGRRARTRSTPLQRTSLESSPSTKIPVPSKRIHVRSPTQTGGPSPESNTSETYRFPTPSPDLAAASNRSSRLFVDHNPSRDSLNPAELELKLSRSLSSDVPRLDDVNLDLKSEPAPFLVDRESLRGSPVSASRMEQVGSSNRKESPPSGTTPTSSRVPAVRRRAETMAPATSTNRANLTPTTLKGRTAQVRQPGSNSSTPVKSSPSNRQLAESPSTLNTTPIHSAASRRTKTATPVSRRRSRGPDSTLARGSPRAISPGTSEFGKITNSPSTSGLAEFPEAFLVPYIPQQTLPKGVRADEVPIPAVERRLMRERLAKEGLQDDELVTVWGLDGTPLMVSKASLAGGLPSGLTEVQPIQQPTDPSLSVPTFSPDGLPRRSSSKRSSLQNSTPESINPDAPICLGPPMLDAERSRKPSLTFASSSYVLPDGPESPAPFQSDRFVPIDPSQLAAPQEELRRKPSLLRKASMSSRQRSQQSLRDRERERGEQRDLTSIRLEDLRPANANSAATSPGHAQPRSQQPWEDNYVRDPHSGNTLGAPGAPARGKNGPTDQHGKKEGCKCLIM